MELLAQLSATIKGKAKVLKFLEYCVCLEMLKTRFNEILDRFVETFVAPRMAATEGGEVAEVTSIKVSILICKKVNTSRLLTKGM